MNGTASRPALEDARRFKPYPKYKDSGVEWLREIPATWGVKKVKRFCLVKRGASPRPIDDPIYFDDEGGYGWVRISDVTRSNKYLEQTEQRLSKLGISKSVCLEPGELFVSIAATVGKPIITRIRCCIHDGFVYFVGLKENREYLFYVFSTGEPYKGLGKLGTQLNLNTDTIGDVRVPVPPRGEQRAIAAFLDRETARIDSLVAKKERLIELLQERRAALITRAVTRGLDPDVPMKDSGVEWLGEIPAHWAAGALSRWWRVIDCKHRTVVFSDEGIPVASINEVQGLEVDLSGAKKTSFEEYRHMIDGDRGPRPGDVIYSRNATIGAASLVATDERFCLGQDVSLIRAVDHDQRFLVSLLRSPAVMSQLSCVMVGSTFNRINVADIKNLIVCVPLPKEQAKIAEACARWHTASEQLIARISTAIKVLTELRTALISAAVTGKIDVREEAV